MNRRFIIGGFMISLTVFGWILQGRTTLSTLLAPGVTSPPVAAPPMSFVMHRSRSVPAMEKLAFVRMQPLLKAHPYAELLANDDRQLLTLQLTQADDHTVISHPELIAAQNRLQLQVSQAAADAQTQLHARATELMREQQREITALVATVQTEHRHDIDTVTMLSAADTALTTLATQQQKNFVAGVSAEQHAVLVSAEAGLDAQAKVALETKAAQLSSDESAFAIKLVEDNADERLRLQLQKSDAKLPNAQRQAMIQRLQTLEQTTAVALAAKRAQDAAVMHQLAADLRAHRGLAAAAAQNTAQLAGDAALSVQTQTTPAASAAAPLPAVTAAPIDLALKARIALLHRGYQTRFDYTEAKLTQEFQAKRAQLQAQFQALTMKDAQVRGPASQEYANLSQKRSALYRGMLKDIHHTITLVAQEQGAQIVVVDPLGAAPDTLDITAEVAHRLNQGDR